ncbi:hypothetical protein [Mycolicibacterium tokaiense]|uniref:Uncharacterized protein n=1 Tax=Mycolicibacterium tokaiense TaxID=39695 RepID=A0A378TC32_9MYCO|nr:hypothetical protein [Mycolicibacterium tokaiense]STZ58180.1 Uncharacterised protein [Mycolicibacterium tokaiense]
MAEFSIPQGMSEYRWILPTAVFFAKPYKHTLLGVLGDSNGTATPLLLVDVNHDSGIATTHQIGTVPADDHNAPAISAAPGDPILVAWNHHGQDTLIRYRVGLPDLPASVVQAPEQTVDVGDVVAYGQAWRVDHLSDQSKVTYYRLYRRTLTDWYLLTEEVDRETLEVTTNAPGTHLISGNGTKIYCTTATGSADAQVVRVAIGTNPSDETINGVSWIEIDLNSGAISTPLDDTFTANVSGTNLPVIPTYSLRLLPNVSQERRLFAARPWPSAMGVLTAEGVPTNRPATARYWLSEWGGQYSSPTVGPPASANGLICPIGASPSCVRSTEVTLADGATSIVMSMDMTLPSTKPDYAYLDLCGQYDGGNGWYAWLGASTNELKLRFVVSRAGGQASTLTSTVPLNGVSWGDRVRIKITYTPTAVAGIRCTMENAVGSSSTWTTIGSLAGNSGAIVVDPDAYSWIGARALDRADGLVVHVAKWTLSGNIATDINFGNDATGWPGYATVYTDSYGNGWSVFGQAVVGRTAYGPVIPPQAIPVRYDLGLVGGTLWASSYPGGAFQGAAIILARFNGSNQEVVLAYIIDGT